MFIQNVLFFTISSQTCLLSVLKLYTHGCTQNVEGSKQTNKQTERNNKRTVEFNVKNAIISSSNRVLRLSYSLQHFKS